MKAFIFDMDGVIIDSESVWKQKEKSFLGKLLGEEIYQKIKGEILGSSTDVVYDLASKYGFKMEKPKFLKKYDEQAILVYREAKLTKDIDRLIECLISLKFKIGLVTASRQLWIDQVLSKLKNKNAFAYVLSLAQKEEFRPKPYPDGYLKIMRQLKSTPKQTIILEDSNKGVEAAEQSGAFTVCLLENLPLGYRPEGADMYVENIKALIKFIKEVNNV